MIFLHFYTKTCKIFTYTIRAWAYSMQQIFTCVRAILVHVSLLSGISLSLIALHWNDDVTRFSFPLCVWARARANIITIKSVSSIYCSRVITIRFHYHKYKVRSLFSSPSLSLSFSKTTNLLLDIMAFEICFAVFNLQYFFVNMLTFIVS